MKSPSKEKACRFYPSPDQERRGFGRAQQGLLSSHEKKTPLCAERSKDKSIRPALRKKAAFRQWLRDDEPKERWRCSLMEGKDKAKGALFASSWRVLSLCAGLLGDIERLRPFPREGKACQGEGYFCA